MTKSERLLTPDAMLDDRLCDKFVNQCIEEIVFAHNDVLETKSTHHAQQQHATCNNDFGSFGSLQINQAAVYSEVGATIRNVNGSVNATAAAIGNSLTVTGF
jgi:hypothetical protein